MSVSFLDDFPSITLFSKGEYDMKTDATSKTQRGKVNVRHNYKRGTSRLRFYPAHKDQLDVVLAALKKARATSDTEYDMVALTYICLQYLSCN